MFSVACFLYKLIEVFFVRLITVEFLDRLLSSVPIVCLIAQGTFISSTTMLSRISSLIFLSNVPKHFARLRYTNAKRLSLISVTCQWRKSRHLVAILIYII